MATVLSKDGKQAVTVIDRFDGGIVNDPRDPRENTCRSVTNFDIFRSPRKLVPYRSSEDGDAGASTKQIQNWAIARTTGTTYKLFGLGLKAGSGTVAGIHAKDIGTGISTSDLDDAGWASANSVAESGSGATDFRLFVYYRRKRLIYGARAGTHIWAFDPEGVAAFNDTEYAISYTDVGQGLVHSKDDILYVPVDNQIIKNDNGAWSVALTLPADYKINCICEYGNFIGIALEPISGLGTSKVYIWDRNTSLATIFDLLDWGIGNLRILEELEGYLIGVSVLSGNAYPTGTERTIFRYYADAPGSSVPTRGAVKFEELFNTSTTRNIQLPVGKQKYDNRIYFTMRIGLGKDGTDRAGLWSIGRSSSNQPFAIVHERTTQNDTALGNGTLLGTNSQGSFFIIGNYTFITFKDDASAWVTRKTDDSSTFSHNSIYDSKRFNAGDSSKRKDLVGVSITTEPLPAAGSVTIGYKTDAQTSFTTILTHDTDNAISESAVVVETTGAKLPKDYKEIEFQIISTGNAEVTGFSFEESITDKRPY